jgi:cyclopropane-fatty-acyl-phospholipid synthase
MEIMDRCLEPGGTMLIESVGGHTAQKNCEAWINRYIFPGGVVPCLKQIDGAIAGRFVRKVTDEWGDSYVHTLRAWHRNLMQAWPAHQQRYDERSRLMFEYFFLTVAGAFRARYLLYWHVLLQKPGQVAAR